jgi:hypothetical protein
LWELARMNTNPQFGWIPHAVSFISTERSSSGST